ncbi:MAG: glycosyltransferase [Prevotella sp.]|nr:glycosyltransferase [Prevotella sp.]
MDNYKLSIIIAMYNSEKYISDCLESIIQSDLPKECFEVIIINDGSTDNGPKIAQEYCAKYENFKYLTQYNQGQSVARNYGIKECHGEYIWCVDSDDAISSDVFSVFNKLVESPDVDILEFKAKQIEEDGSFVNVVGENKLPYNTILSGRDAICGGYQPATMWRLFARKDLLIKNNLFFVPGIIHQDAELAYRLYAHAEKVIFVDDPLYIYINHPNSTINAPTSEKKLKRLLDDIVVLKSFSRLSQEHLSDSLMSEVIKHKSMDVLFGIVYTLFRKRKEYSIDNINKKVIKKLREEELYPINYDYHSFKKNIVKRILNIESVLYI